jgi:tetratricopeptide (TPR) repeat protein
MVTQTTFTTEPTEPAGSPPTPGQLWQVPTFLLGLLLAVCMALIPLSPEDPKGQLENDLEAIRKVLSQPHAAADRVLGLAESALAHSDAFPEFAGEAHFLLGSVYLRLAEEGPSERAAELYRKARTHLERAEALSVPFVDHHRLLYRLGKVWFYTDADLKRTIDYLNRSITAGAEDQAEGYGILVRAYLRLPVADLDAALEANQKQLEHTEDEDVLVPARLLRAELLMRRKDHAAALKALEGIGNSAPQELRLRARVLEALCCQEEGLWGRAIVRWKEVLQAPKEVPGGRGRVHYFLGLCYLHGEQPEADKALPEWDRALTFGGEEAQAAAFRLAREYLHGAEPARALDYFKRAVETIKSPKEYRNTLFDREQASKLFECGFNVFCKRSDFERFEQLASLYQKLAEPGVAETWRARASQKWAEHLCDQVLLLEGPKASELLQRAHALFCKAGQVYQVAAAARNPKDSADALRLSAACYLQGQEPDRAATVLVKLLELPLADEQLAEGWFILAQTLQTLKRKEDATQAYLKCMEYPTSFGAQARYQLALIRIQEKEFDKAQKILEQILEKARSNPDEPTYEKALFRLANLLFERGNFGEAHVGLENAARQYPANPEAMLARDRRGECFWQLALEALKLANNSAFKEKKKFYEEKQRGWLQKAEQVYEEIARDLQAQSTAKMSMGERVLLRRALFKVADLLYFLGNYEEAFAHYENLATKRYPPRTRESLMAYYGMNGCCCAWAKYENTMALAKARGLAMVKDVQDALNSMKDDDPAFRPPPASAWSKQRWQKWVDDQRKDFENLPVGMH